MAGAACGAEPDVATGSGQGRVPKGQLAAPLPGILLPGVVWVPYHPLQYYPGCSTPGTPVPGVPTSGYHLRTPAVRPRDPGASWAQEAPAGPGRRHLEVPPAGAVLVSSVDLARYPDDPQGHLG